VEFEKKRKVAQKKQNAAAKWKQSGTCVGKLRPEGGKNSISTPSSAMEEAINEERIL